MSKLMQQLTGITEEQYAEEMGYIDSFAIDNYDPLYYQKPENYEAWCKEMRNRKSVNGCPRTKNRTIMSRKLRSLRLGKRVKFANNDPYFLSIVIIDNMDHKSFMYEDYAEIMDDMEFLYFAAKRTASPQDCPNFFYDYVNPYLKKNAKFRLNFLKSLYLNDHVLTKEEILWFVETYGFEEENEIIIHDELFKEAVEDKFCENRDLDTFLERHNKVFEVTKGKRRLKSYTDFNNEYQARIKSLLSCFELEETCEDDEEIDFEFDFNNFDN